MANNPSYSYHFEPHDHAGALACLERHGFCVLRGMIGPALVQDLKDSIDRHLDPERSLPPASNKYHMAFAEVSEPVWKLVDHAPYWELICAVNGTRDLCLAHGLSRSSRDRAAKRESGPQPVPAPERPVVLPAPLGGDPAHPRRGDGRLAHGLSRSSRDRAAKRESGPQPVPAPERPRGST